MNQSEEKQLKEAWQINAELMAGLEVGAGRYKQLRELNTELLEVLIKLTNEALASVELARPCIGNTNANCLLVRATEGRRLIAKAEKLQ